MTGEVRVKRGGAVPESEREVEVLERLERYGFEAAERRDPGDVPVES